MRMKRRLNWKWENQILPAAGADCDADFGTKGRNPSQWLVWGFSLIENLSKGLGHVRSRDGMEGCSSHKLPINGGK